MNKKGKGNGLNLFFKSMLFTACAIILLLIGYYSASLFFAPFKL